MRPGTFSTSATTDIDAQGVTVTTRGGQNGTGLRGVFTGTLTDSTLDITGGNIVGIYLLPRTQATIERTTIRARGTDISAIGVLWSTASSAIRSSSISADAPVSTLGIYGDPLAGGLILQSTIVVGAASETQIAISTHGPMAIVNSALVRLGGACTGTCYGVEETLTTSPGTTGFNYFSQLVAFANNAIIAFGPDNFTTQCSYFTTAADFTDCPDANDYSQISARPYYRSNVFESALEDAKIDATYRPNPNSPLANADIDPDSSVCQSNGHSVATPACGGASNDFENQPYGTVPDIGYLRAAQEPF